MEQIRKNEGEIENAIDRAISEMPDDFEIKPYLMAHRAEVKGMLLTEYNEAATMELFREEGREEGRIEGRREGRREGWEEGRKEGFLHALIRMVRGQKISVEEAAQEAEMTTDEFTEEMKKT